MRPQLATLKHVLFDLDGTLIDSSPSILQSFAAAFASVGVAPIRPLTPEVIGPPLMPTLTLLTGSEDAALLSALADAFKLAYDSHAYSLATVFDGIASMLQALHGKGLSLYIATNKRILPTHKIMQHLQWPAYFQGVYALDAFQPAAVNKADMIRLIIERHGLSAEECLFVGDRLEDGQSADANHMAFALVEWGYMDESVGSIPTHWVRYKKPDELCDLILSHCSSY